MRQRQLDAFQFRTQEAQNKQHDWQEYEQQRQTARKALSNAIVIIEKYEKQQQEERKTMMSDTKKHYSMVEPAPTPESMDKNDAMKLSHPVLKLVCKPWREALLTPVLRKKLVDNYPHMEPYVKLLEEEEERQRNVKIMKAVDETTKRCRSRSRTKLRD